MTKHEKYINRAIELSTLGMDSGAGGPFGCVIVKNGQIIAEAFNEVIKNNDPTAHAEIQAIRTACKNLKTYQLNDCYVYCSCEPCPMCLGALYWARPKHIFFANTRKDAAEAGFDDDFIYKEILIEPHKRKIPLTQIQTASAIIPLKKWSLLTNKKLY
jgi:tRNA(Arg) A34 adenosine deaminase TadA